MGVTRSDRARASRSSPSPHAVAADPPRTLKEALDAMLADGAAAGHLQDAMRLVADVERRLAIVAASIGYDRRTETAGGRALPTVAVVTEVSESEATLGGGWIPGLIAAAGGRTVGVSEGEAGVTIPTSELTRLSPDVLVIAEPDRGFDDLRIPPELGPAEAGRIVVIDGRRYVNTLGPSIARSVELLAFAVHGDRSGVTPLEGELKGWNADGPE